MLSYRMDTYGSEYDEYVSKYFEDMYVGDASSFYRIVGSQPKHLFVCRYVGTVKYAGKNDVYQVDNRIYLDTKNFRNSANNFNFIASTYVLLELIRMKVPGIYLFLSQEYEKGNYVNGTEYFPYENDSDQLGYKIKNCDVTLYLGNYGNQDLLYTSAGHRAASDEFVSVISKHFSVTPKLEHVVHALASTSVALSDFSGIVPENVVLPCGVDHFNGAKNITDENAHEFFADHGYIIELIEKLKQLTTIDLPINRVPNFDEFLGFDLDEDKNSQQKPNPESKGFWSWLKG